MTSLIYIKNFFFHLQGNIVKVGQGKIRTFTTVFTLNKGKKIVYV